MQHRADTGDRTSRLAVDPWQVVTSGMTPGSCNVARLTRSQLYMWTAGPVQLSRLGLDFHPAVAQMLVCGHRAVRWLWNIV